MVAVLVGRGFETTELCQLIEHVRAGDGQALALEGEPGAGKSVLLSYAAAQAPDMTVLTARGVPSESEISFSGLLELLRPLLVHLPELPPPQAAALAGAMALGPPTGGDRFAVYAATLSLLARAAQDRPVLAIVDDVHWLDTASAEAVRFAARRVRDEPVGMLFALRPGEFDASGLSVLRVEGLGREASLELLPVGVAPDVTEELLRVTGGNPLALVEIPALLTAGQLGGREPLDDPMRVGARAERAFLTRFETLPVPARSALLVAAASGSRTVDSLLRALAASGLDASALEAAESAGLVNIDGFALEFRHPLVRSTVYHGSPAGDRRAAHRALASALSDDRDEHATVRRAWHLAAAAIGPDEDVAEQLDAAARDARDRAGYAAAAIAFERAAELTPDGDARASRNLRAVEAWQLAGRSGRAVTLLESTLPGITDPLLRATACHLSGRIDMWRGPATAAKVRLISEAARIEPVAPELAARMLTDAVTGSIVSGAIEEAVSLGRRAHAAAAPIGGLPELLAALQLGKALILHGEPEGDALILRCVELMQDENPLQHAMELAHCLPALMTIEAYETARAVADRVIPAARTAGAFGLLAYCLGAQAELDARIGHWASAYADGFESVDLARESGQTGQLSYNLARLAWVEAGQGREEACLAHAAEALELADALGFGSSTLFAEAALGLLELGTGQSEVAIDRLGALLRADALGVREPNRIEFRSDLIEAAVRAGRLDVAEHALADLARGVERSRRPMSVAALHRARGLLASDEDFAAEFEAALVAHGAGRTPFERARTQLCFGERLRRARRRAEGRTQLRAAVAQFDLLGARPWAERARVELRASGETARKRDPTSAEQLTAQELQVARIVANGASNREAAAALFVSPKTIDSHLHSAYRKLGIRSRTELARHVLGGDDVVIRTPG